MSNLIETLTTNWREVLASLHPVVLHLPIGLLALLVLLELRHLRGPRPSGGALRTMVLLLAVFGPLAAASGWFLGDAGYGAGIAWHRRLGIATGTLSLGIALAYWLKPSAYRPLLLLGAATMTAAAHLGASETHGDDFLYAPFLVEETAHAPTKAEAAKPKPAEPEAVTPERTEADSVVPPTFKSFTSGAVGIGEEHFSGPELPTTPIEELTTHAKILADYIARLDATEPRIPGNGFSYPPTLPENISLALAPASPEALADLAAALVHVERLAPDSPMLAVDFTAAAPDPGAIAKLLAPIAGIVAELNLFQAKPSDEDLWVVGAMPRLESLNLSQLDLGAQALKWLSLSPLQALRSLRVLNLTGTQTHADIEILEGLKTLERVFVLGTTLKAQDLKRLAKARPDLTIIGASPPPSEPVEVEPDVTFTTFVEAAESSDTEAQIAATLTPGNTTCPVTGKPIDPRYTILFEGRVIGFCCPNCPKTFWQDPSKYQAALDAQ